MHIMLYFQKINISNIANDYVTFLFCLVVAQAQPTISCLMVRVTELELL